MEMYDPPHPGEFIEQTYLEPLGMSRMEAAKLLGVQRSTFNRLVRKEASVSPEMALRLQKVFKRSAESWLTMQNNYTLYHTRQSLNLNALEPLDFNSYLASH